MRKLMWFTLGFSGACGICAYGRENIWIPLAAATAVILAVAVLWCAKQKRLLRPAVAVLAGCFAGILWFGAFYAVYLSPLQAMEGKQVPLHVTVSDFSRESPYGTSAEGIVKLDGKPYWICLYLDEQLSLNPGDIVTGDFRLRLTTAGEQYASAYSEGKGEFLFAHQQGDIQIVEASTVPFWAMPAVLRRNILKLLEVVFPEDTSIFAKALLLGETRDLEYATDTALKISGIRHVVAVSGLHISVLFGVMQTLTMKRRYLTALIGMPALVVFAAVAGFTPSVLRACIMVGLMMLAMIFDREYDPATALSFAVLVMLLFNPLAVTSVSLQLSAGCVTGILLFNAPIKGWMKDRLSKKAGRAERFQNFVCSSIAMTLSSMSLVTPLSAAYFNTVSLLSPLTNLLTLWVVTFLFSGIILTCLLYLAVPAAAFLLAQALSWPARYVLATARILSSFPLAAVYTHSLCILLWLIFVYFLLAVFLWTKGKRPGVVLCWGILGLCLALIGSWLPPLTADAQVTMLDVGQGQSILLQTEGKTFLVDCGGDKAERTADLIAGTLLSQGIARLDGIILTHHDLDHSGALSHLLSRIGTDYLFLPDTRNEMMLPDTDGEIIYVWEDLEISAGAAKLHIFGPVYSGSSNENSLCVLFDTEKCDILITGDRSGFGERMLLRRRELPDVDILVAGHHGAEDASCMELLTQVKPETVLISVGENNIYGHPAPSLLERLESQGCTVRRTDEEGTIVIRR